MIDFHSHFFSRVFFETLAAQSPLPGSIEEKLRKVCDKTGLVLPDKDVARHTERWIGMLDQHGVDHIVSFASLPEEAPVLMEAVQHAKGSLTAFALVNPRADGAAQKARALLAGGFRGILLFPAMHGFDPSGEEAAAVLKEVDDAGAFAVVHCGMLQVKLRDLLGLPRPYDFSFSNPLRLVPAANRFRKARFVIPHFGAGMFRETLLVGSQCENVYVDTSSSNSWMATDPSGIDLAGVFARAVGVFGAQRVLFGTDSSTLPRGWRHDLLKDQLVAMEKAGVGNSDRQRILDGNARALLGLDASAVS